MYDKTKVFDLKDKDKTDIQEIFEIILEILCYIRHSNTHSFIPVEFNNRFIPVFN